MCIHKHKPFQKKLLLLLLLLLLLYEQKLRKRVYNFRVMHFLLIFGKDGIMRRRVVMQGLL